MELEELLKLAESDCEKFYSLMNLFRDDSDKTLFEVYRALYAHTFLYCKLLKLCEEG